MADGKAVRPPETLEWLNKSQLTVLTRFSPRVVKRVMEVHSDKIPQRQADAKTQEYKCESALRALYADQMGVAGGEDGQVDIKSAETSLKVEQAKNYQIKNEILVRKLIRTEDLEMHWVGIVSAMRAKMLSLPVILAQQCVNIDDIKKIESIAEEIVYEALHELSAQLLPEPDDNTLDEDSDFSGSSTEATAEANT
jgi:phage terminase Nu1 subunit (DNA packaging protein)